MDVHGNHGEFADGLTIVMDSPVLSRVTASSSDRGGSECWDFINVLCYPQLVSIWSNHFFWEVDAPSLTSKRII
mgnify:CR=1 FL=1